MTAHRQKRYLKADQLKERMQESNRCIDVYLKYRIDEALRGVSRRFIAAEIARVFMEADPVLARLYRGFGGSLIVQRCETDWIHGEDLLTLRFQEKATAKLKELCSDNRFCTGMNGILAGKGETFAIGMDSPPPQQLTLLIRVPWKCDPAGYLKEHSLKHTVLRMSDGWMRFQFTKDSMKKNILHSMKIYPSAIESMVEIVPGEKFSYNEYIHSVVELPTERHIVRVLCKASVGESIEADR